MREVTADLLKSDAVAYINRQFEPFLNSNFSGQQPWEVEPILKPGKTRDLVILLMCGFAAQVAEQSRTASDVPDRAGWYLKD